MKAAATLALVFLVFASASYSDEKWPLVINADPTWQIDYTGDGIHFFNLTRPDGENVAFTCHNWPAFGGREQVPVYVRRIADNFAKDNLTNLILFVAKEDYEMEKIFGTEFSGEAAIFKNWDSTLVVIFMVSDGDGIWKGQYSGSQTTWERAKIVLQNFRRAKK